jgi:hypothetical protein
MYLTVQLNASSKCEVLIFRVLLAVFCVLIPKRLGDMKFVLHIQKYFHKAKAGTIL